MKGNFFILLFLSSNCFSQSEVFRVYSEKKEKINFECITGKINLPSGSRVVKLEMANQYLVYDKDQKKYQNCRVVNKSIHFRKWLPEDQNREEEISFCQKYSSIREVLINEAGEAIDLARKNKFDEYQKIHESLKDQYPEMAKDYRDVTAKFRMENLFYDNFISKLESKISKLDSRFEDKAFVEKISLRYQEKINPHIYSRVKKMDYYQKIIREIFDPIDESKLSFSQTTLYIPITQKWIKSDPGISGWFEKNWIEQGIPMPFSGNSGEGISFKTEDFQQIRQGLLELKKFLVGREVLQVTKAKRSDIGCGVPEPPPVNEETKWILQLEDSSFKNTLRMIFIHENNWENNLTGNMRDYIPVDQSLACFPSNAFLSTLSHELNVNSGNQQFFPGDTHADFDNKNQNNLERLSYAELKGLVAREPYLQTIYLSILLSLLDEDS